MNNKRIKDTDKTGIKTYSELIGASVTLTKISTYNSLITKEYNDFKNAKFTIDSIKFRISLDGKCFTVITLKEFPDLIFTWKDIKLL